ncbi:hypothetical protein PMIN01_04695 [Paraphaeosphaeria minitans]|uniref:Uncharacterized protein n=1 Tax=Paraphaeosphaeria minitans TaxID=565426 RepID=A0A9P6KSI4_9PLEO|nr:hypothetical protein PMIN01_04695 [Paraphaeosphaeria minitans]
MRLVPTLGGGSAYAMYGRELHLPPGRGFPAKRAGKLARRPVDRARGYFVQRNGAGGSVCQNRSGAVSVREEDAKVRASTLWGSIRRSIVRLAGERGVLGKADAHV